MAADQLHFQHLLCHSDIEVLVLSKELRYSGGVPDGGL
jgi:hypothetical protein